VHTHTCSVLLEKGEYWSIWS